jgi:hypothetical protein
MATTLNAGTTTATGLNVTADVSGAMAIQTSGTTAIAISTAQVVTLTNALLPASGGTGLSSLGTGVATFLGTPTSANLAAALTDETGTGVVVFATSPTLVTPALGTPTALVGTNITGTAAGLSIGGNAATATTATNANAIANTGGWAITPSSTKLYFSYNGTNVASMDSYGNFKSLLTVAAGTTP